MSLHHYDVRPFEWVIYPLGGLWWVFIYLLFTFTFKSSRSLILVVISGAATVESSSNIS